MNTSNTVTFTLVLSTQHVRGPVINGTLTNIYCESGKVRNMVFCREPHSIKSHFPRGAGATDVRDVTRRLPRLLRAQLAASRDRRRRSHHGLLHRDVAGQKLLVDPAEPAPRLGHPVPCPRPHRRKHLRVPHSRREHSRC